MLDYRDLFISKWEELGLDALICPVMPFPSPPHGGTEFTIVGASYCMLWNYLNFPTGVVPVTQVHSNETNFVGEHNDGVDKEVAKIMHGSAGLPVAVQVVSMINEDEKALGLMKQIEEAFRFHKFAL
jgi:Asp-tRNA(Asn)/Glu-tRNA(Gln) amidotransferase A subunit family amidase